MNNHIMVQCMNCSTISEKQFERVQIIQSSKCILELEPKEIVRVLSMRTFTPTLVTIMKHWK